MNSEELIPLLAEIAEWFEAEGFELFPLTCRTAADLIESQQARIDELEATIAIYAEYVAAASDDRLNWTSVGTENHRQLAQDRLKAAKLAFAASVATAADYLHATEETP